MATHDLVVRGGNTIDGSGGAARTADVAIDGPMITAVPGAANTICAGEEIYQNGVATGALPGRLIRHAG